MKGGGLTSQLVKGSVTPLSFAAVTQTVIFEGTKNLPRGATKIRTEVRTYFVVLSLGRENHPNHVP